MIVSISRVIWNRLSLFFLYWKKPVLSHTTKCVCLVGKTLLRPNKETATLNSNDELACTVVARSICGCVVHWCFSNRKSITRRVSAGDVQIGSWEDKMKVRLSTKNQHNTIYPLQSQQFYNFPWLLLFWEDYQRSCSDLLTYRHKSISKIWHWFWVQAAFWLVPMVFIWIQGFVYSQDLPYQTVANL